MNHSPVILVIDDSRRVIRQVAEIALGRIDSWRVLTVESGHQGLQVAARERPDVVLLDVVMPDLDGPAALSALLREREATRDIPVIFLTGKSEDEDRRGYEALGATAMIGKPFDPQTLPDRVRQRPGLADIGAPRAYQAEREPIDAIRAIWESSRPGGGGPARRDRGGHLRRPGRPAGPGTARLCGARGAQAGGLRGDVRLRCPSRSKPASSNTPSRARSRRRPRTCRDWPTL